MTKLNETRSLKQEWSSFNFDSEKLKRLDDTDNDEKTNREKTFEALYEEMSSWSLGEDSYTDHGIGGRLSSLTSWGDDDFEKRSAQEIAELFAKIDDSLYENIPFGNEKLQQECLDWAERFPHIRVTGCQISSLSISPDRMRPPSVTLSQSVSERRKERNAAKVLENYEEVFAHHSSDSQSENKSELNQFSSNSPFRDQVLDSLFNILWTDVTPVLVQFIKNWNKKPFINKRRRSDPETSKRRPDETIDVQNLSPDQRETSIALPNYAKQNFLKRSKSPHYMLPTVSSTTLKKTNLISANSKSRIISAAIHRTPHRLMPINVDFQTHNVASRKSKPNEHYFKPITARLPPIDMNGHFPNVPSKPTNQRSISSYSTRSLISTMLPLSRSHTNETFFEEDEINSLNSTLIISPILNKRRDVEASRKQGTLK